uniref:Uncharacterized protein n=1 Tax=Timema tahoe TaxID=61484 RepID=A0A7R9NY87_9NEOP|nr:unnamed protein product [Timema tahoe]
MMVTIIDGTAYLQAAARALLYRRFMMRVLGVCYYNINMFRASCKSQDEIKHRAQGCQSLLFYR